MTETPKELDAAVRLVLDYKPPKDRGEQSAEARKPDGSAQRVRKAKLRGVGQFVGGMVTKILTMLGVLSVVVLFLD